MNWDDTGDLAADVMDNARALAERQRYGDPNAAHDQEDLIQDYMDQVGLRILMAEHRMASDIALHMRVKHDRPSGFQLVKMHADLISAVAQRKVIEYERWLASNSFRIRHLPHVEAQRAEIVGRKAPPALPR